MTAAGGGGVEPPPPWQWQRQYFCVGSTQDSNFIGKGCTEIMLECENIFFFFLTYIVCLFVIMWKGIQSLPESPQSLPAPTHCRSPNGPLPLPSCKGASLHPGLSWPTGPMDKLTDRRLAAIPPALPGSLFPFHPVTWIPCSSHQRHFCFLPGPLEIFPA